jgi:hypothetical protein
VHPWVLSLRCIPSPTRLRALTPAHGRREGHIESEEEEEEEEAAA